MKKVQSYNEYQALKAINEAIDDYIQSVDQVEATKIKDLVNNQEEIFKKYNLSDTEINNIKGGIEDSIRVKLGIDFNN